MFILRKALSVGHLGIIMCKRGAEQKRPCLVATATWEADVTYFRSQGHVIERVETFN